MIPGKDQKNMNFEEGKVTADLRKMFCAQPDSSGSQAGGLRYKDTTGTLLF